MKKKGDVVTIYNNRLSDGKEIVEGKAKLVRHIRGYDDIPSGFQRWAVEFTDEPGRLVERSVDVIREDTILAEKKSPYSAPTGKALRNEQRINQTQRWREKK